MRLAARKVLFATASFLIHLPHFRGRNRLFTIALRLAQRLGPPVIVEIEGFTLQLDLRDGVCRGLWAERAFPQGLALRTLCQPGDVVIDVGANVGYMALIAAREVGATGRVVAIEPGQRSFGLLALNAARNFPDRIVAVRAACDEADGTATLFVSDYSEEYNSLRPESVIGGAHEEVVPARSLRSISRELGITPDVVKIDVEGAEWRVLKGLLDDDAPRPRTLMVEAYIGNSRGFGYLPSAMCAWLRDQGYSLSLSRDTEQFEYSDARADGPLLHDVVAVRVERSPGSGVSAPS
jgi:FkbM family methyltransferase